MNTSSSSGDDDPLREARAYNQSIYLMAAMPYLLLGTVGFMIYRGVKAAQRANGHLPGPNEEGPNQLPNDGEGSAFTTEVERE
jgi:hypothetical protein